MGYSDWFSRYVMLRDRTGAFGKKRMRNERIVSLFKMVETDSRDNILHRLRIHQTHRINVWVLEDIVGLNCTSIEIDVTSIHFKESPKSRRNGYVVLGSEIQYQFLFTQRRAVYKSIYSLVAGIRSHASTYSKPLEIRNFNLKLETLESVSRTKMFSRIRVSFNI